MGLRVIKKSRRGTSLYRPWTGSLLASGAAPAIEFRTGVVLAAPTCLTRLRVPRVLGSHYRVTSLRAGREELLASPTMASAFSEDCEKPSLMIFLPRGAAISVAAVKVTGAAVPFVAILQGLQGVRGGRCRGEVA